MAFVTVSVFIFLGEPTGKITCPSLSFAGCACVCVRAMKPTLQTQPPNVSIIITMGGGPGGGGLGERGPEKQATTPLQTWVALRCPAKKILFVG